MLQRKIYKRIEDFYKNHPNKALMIVGARQVGKSYIVEEFCKVHYKSFIKMDFIENPDYISALAGAKSTEEVLLRLSALFGDKMIPGKTIFFFDDIIIDIEHRRRSKRCYDTRSLQLPQL